MFWFRPVGRERQRWDATARSDGLSRADSANFASKTTPTYGRRGPCSACSSCRRGLRERFSPVRDIARATTPEVCARTRPCPISGCRRACGPTRPPSSAFFTDDAVGQDTNQPRHQLGLRPSAKTEAQAKLERRANQNAERALGALRALGAVRHHTYARTRRLAYVSRCASSVRGRRRS